MYIYIFFFISFRFSHLTLHCACKTQLCLVCICLPPVLVYFICKFSSEWYQWFRKADMLSILSVSSFWKKVHLLNFLQTREKRTLGELIIGQCVLFLLFRIILRFVYISSPRTPFPVHLRWLICTFLLTFNSWTIWMLPLTSGDNLYAFSLLP